MMQLLRSAVIVRAGSGTGDAYGAAAAAVGGGAPAAPAGTGAVPVVGAGSDTAAAAAAALAAPLMARTQLWMDLAVGEGEEDGLEEQIQQLQRVLRSGVVPVNLVGLSATLAFPDDAAKELRIARKRVQQALASLPQP